MKRYILLLLLLATNALAQDLRNQVVNTSLFSNTTLGSMTAHTLADSTTSVGYVVQAPEAATITQLCVTYGARTGTPPAYKIGMETVNTSGIASGTYKTGTGECSATFTPPADGTWNGTEQCFTLTGTTCSLTRGEDFAVTIKYASGTVDGSNNSSFVYRAGVAENSQIDLLSDTLTYPYTITTGGAAVKHQYVPVISWTSSTRTFGYPLVNFGSVGFSSDTSPDEYALRFTYNCPAGQTYSISGLSAAIKLPVTAKSLKAILYSGTTVVHEYLWDSDKQSGGSGGIRSGKFLFTDTLLSTLTCGTAYRLAIQPQDVSTSLELYYNEVATNADFDAWPLGISAYLSSRVDAGAWTDNTARRPRIAPIIASINTVSGGGGGTSELVSSGTVTNGLATVGSTSYCKDIPIVRTDTGARLTGVLHNSGGISATYHRDNAVAPVAITLVNGTVGTYASGSFKEIGTTGVYQVCIPDAALLAGAKNVKVIYSGVANMAPAVLDIDLLGNLPSDLLSASVPELSAIPTDGAESFQTIVRAVYQRFFHKTSDDNTTNERQLFRSGGVTKLCEAPLTKSGNIFTTGACGAVD